jgi:hypothetical protein
MGLRREDTVLVWLIMQKKKWFWVDKSSAEKGFFMIVSLITKRPASSIEGLKDIYEWLTNIVKQGFWNFFAGVPVN